MVRGGLPCSLSLPGLLHGLKGVDKAVAGLGIEPFISHVGGGPDDDLAGFPGLQLGIGREHEGDGSAEHGAGEGVAAAGGGGLAPGGREQGNPEVEGTDFGLVDPSLAVMFGLPFDRALAGKGGAAEVALDAGSGEDGDL